MADFAPHSKKPSNGTIYSNNDVFGGSSKFRISTVVDDYTEIFTSRSSIPFLDLPPETDSEISSIFDYSEIFGGFQDFENYAVPYQELFLESKSLEKETASSSSSEDVWTPAGSVSPSEDSFENPLTSESTQAFSNTESHYASDGAEQFSMSYHKANQIGKEDSISGTTRIAQLNAVPAYTLVVDENISLQTTKFEEALPEVSKKHNLNELTNDSRMDEEHYWEAMPPQPASESTQTHEKNLDENKIYKKKPFMTVSEISLRTQPLEVPPPSRPPPKLSKQGSHKIMPSDLKPSAKYPRQGVANDSSPPFFDVEVDSTSSAAASAAAMKEAMEKAQATLKSAREMMGGLQRKKMGIKESSKLNEERPHIENGRMHSELKGFDKEERQKGIGTSHATNELKLKPRAVSAASVSVDRSHLKQPELSHEFLQREIIGEWKAEEQFYELVKKDTVETVLVAPKDKKSDRNVLPSPRLFDQDENEKKAGNAAFVQQEKSNGKLQASEKACESKEDEKRVNVSMDACERVEHEEKIKAAEIIHDQEGLQKEERARQLKETLEREEAEKKAKAVRAREENEKRRRDALQREETERREREENERREREAFEREENERREREAFEREEKEKREREALEREESEKREKEAYEREEKEKRLKEAREREEQERKLKEVERRLIEVREKEENERKLKEAHEREEQERKLKEAERRLIEVLEKEEKERKLKEAHDREERERIMKEVREREENERRLREIREKEENERRLKEQLEREEIQRKLLLAAEEEKKLRQARESEENERRLKEAREREDNERRLIEAREREEQEKILQEAHEREENGRRLREQLEREEHERRLKEELKREENQRKLAQAAEETERLLHEAQEREETERRIKEEHQREENEKRVRECQEKEENEKKLKQAAEENERRLKEVQKQEEIENISKESSEEVTEKLLLQDTFVKANVAAQKAKVDNSDKKTEIIEIAVREEKDRQQKKESITTSQMVGPSTNNGIKRDHEKEEIVKEKEQEKERLKKLEEEKQREREREKDRIAVESVTREAHERAFAEARERAERAAVERATTEVRQRAMVEARERLEKACAEAREKSLAEKAYAEAQARLRSERAAVERATTEARERAEKAMREKAMRDRVERSVSEKFSTTSRDSVLRHNASFSNTRDAQFQNSTSSFTGSQRYSDKSQGTECDSVQRCKAKLEREQRTVERAAKALAEKNSRDYLAQREQIERNRLAETLDADVKRWSNGKEGNLRALLSTLQYILGADSGWQPVPLTDVVTAVAVKKAYRKATLCVHPDKVQQRGANIQQKYVCEKVFDLLKDAWTKFNSEER